MKLFCSTLVYKYPKLGSKIPDNKERLFAPPAKPLAYEFKFIILKLYNR